MTQHPTCTPVQHDEALAFFAAHKLLRTRQRAFTPRKSTSSMPSSIAAGKKSPTGSERQHPEALIDEIVRIVQGFAGEIPQEDDINCVALRVEEIC